MTRFMRRVRVVFGGVLVTLLAAGAAQAQELTIGVQVEPTSIDPHFANVDTNNAMARNFFTPLVIRDEKLQPTPGLAVSWKALDDQTWEFKLRQGVKFHDGSDFTAEDVKFSLERAPNIPNSPSSLAVYLKQVTGVEIVDKYTVRIKTNKVFPLMPLYMGTFVIVSKKAAENATTADFNSGKALVGTGPFKFVEWVKGDRLVMERFDGYWGENPDWKKVTFKAIKSAPARVAALLSGDVDMIDFVPTTDIPKLKTNKKFKLSQSATSRLIFLTIDQGQDNSPKVTDKNGKPFTEKGPLRDVRVRKAISLAIDRQAISDRIMDGASVPSGQMMPKGFSGYLPDVPVPAYDPDGAKKLLAEAGFGDGFRVTMNVPNRRYVNDVDAMEAIAQMLARIGIEAKIETVPVSSFFKRATKREFSLFMIGFGIVTGEPSSILAFVIATHDKARGLGVGNRGRYSNKKVDDLLLKARATVDADKREKLLREAIRIALSEQAIIPIHHQVHTWGMRSGLEYTPRADEYTYAFKVRKAN